MSRRVVWSCDPGQLTRAGPPLSQEIRLRLLVRCRPWKGPHGRTRNSSQKLGAESHKRAHGLKSCGISCMPYDASFTAAFSDIGVILSRDYTAGTRSKVIFSRHAKPDHGARKTCSMAHGHMPHPLGIYQAHGRPSHVRPMTCLGSWSCPGMMSVLGRRATQSALFWAHNGRGVYDAIILTSSLWCGCTPVASRGNGKKRHVSVM